MRTSGANRHPNNKLLEEVLSAAGLLQVAHFYFYTDTLKLRIRHNFQYLNRGTIIKFNLIFYDSYMA